MHRAHTQAVIAVAIVGLAFGAGLYAGVTELQTRAASNDFTKSTIPADVDLASFWKTWATLEERYVPTAASSTLPTQEERVWGAIQGLVASYKDPYTVFLPPEEAENFEEQISGAFEGVGMEIGIREGVLVVVSPLKNSPAERAGVKSGDKIILIVDISAARLPFDEAVSQIRGKGGTVVMLTLKQEGEPELLKISITRSTIEIPTVEYYLRDDGIYVIELYNFSAVSVERFREALRAFVLSRSTKLILDLRGNPGGYLEASVEMASFFLPIGKSIVSEDFAGKRENVVHRSRGYDVFKNRKLAMAILVDGGSASASEILAGALQAHNIATLVGKKTFGKGSVQQLVEVGDGAELKITIARWLTPDGISISAGGLTPDIIVDITKEDVAEDRDPQQDAAVNYLLKK